MGVTIHLWGLNGKASLVSPESVALLWLLNDIPSGHEVTVVFSNNTDLSPNQQLPLLIEGDKKLYGFTNIAGFLYEQESALEMALLHFAHDHICALTQYQLYLNKTNYDGFTRKIFAYLLEWPMWYNTPLKYRALARERCETLGYFGHVDDEDQPDQPDQQLDSLVQSQAFKATQASKARNADLLKSARYNLQYLTRLGEQVTNWLEARAKLKKSAVPADYLLWANLFVQLELPDGKLVSEHLQKCLGQSTYQEITTKLKACSQADLKFSQRDPTFAERGNILTSAYNAVQRLVSM